MGGIKDILSERHFSFPIEHYNKEASFAVLKTYYTNKVKYLTDVYNITEEKASEYVRSLMNKRLKRPTLSFYERDPETRDKEIKETYLDAYLDNVRKRDDVILPSLTTYFKHDFALDAEWTKDKVSERNEYKKLKKKAQQAGDEDLTDRYDKQQKTKKTGANSLSGVSAISSSPIHTFSIHYSLTSSTRVTTSSAYMTSERMFGGNRNWLSEEDAIEDLIMHSKYFIKEDMEKMQKEFNLKIPDPEMIRHYVFEKVLCWEHSDLKIGLTKLQAYINKKTDLERLFIVYAMDFKAISDYSPDTFNRFISDWTKRPRIENSSSDLSCITNSPYNVQNFLYTVNNDYIIQGSLNMKDYENTSIGDIFMGAYTSLGETMSKYEYFIKALFKNVQCTQRRLGQGKFMIKTSTVLSDTDSVCYGANRLLQNQIDPMLLNPYNIRIMAPLVYFFSEKLHHTLSIYTSLANAKECNREQVSMKAEAMWTVFTPINKAKHYITSEHQSEFFIKGEGEIDASGVHLIGGKMPAKLKEIYETFRTETIREIEFYSKINHKELIRRALVIEARVISLLINNPKEVLLLETIKPAEEYADYKTKGIKSTLAFHKVMYDRYFKQFFNNQEAEELPQLYAKVYIKQKNSRYNTLEDLKEYAFKLPTSNFTSLNEFYDMEKVNAPSSIRIPFSVIEKEGLPVDWIAELDIASTINKTFAPFYKFLSALGILKGEDELLFQSYT